LAARKKRDLEMAAEHKAKLEARKAEFEKLFKNVWTTGTTGTSRIILSTDEFGASDKVFHAWFNDTMVAEVTTLEHSARTYRKIKQHNITNGTIDNLVTMKENVVMTAISTDERIAEAIETAVENSGDENLRILINPW
jgi:hypothetical protein